MFLILRQAAKNLPKTYELIPSCLALGTQSLPVREESNSACSRLRRKGTSFLSLSTIINNDSIISLSGVMSLDPLVDNLCQ